MTLPKTPEGTGIDAFTVVMLMYISLGLLIVPMLFLQFVVGSRMSTSEMRRRRRALTERSQKEVWVRILAVGVGLALLDGALLAATVVMIWQVNVGDCSGMGCPTDSIGPPLAVVAGVSGILAVIFTVATWLLLQRAYIVKCERAEVQANTGGF